MSISVLSSFRAARPLSQWVVSWLSVGMMLVVNVIAAVGPSDAAVPSPSAAMGPADFSEAPRYAQRKLHFLTREHGLLKSLLKTCGARVHTCGRRG